MIGFIRGLLLAWLGALFIKLIRRLLTGASSQHSGAPVQKNEKAKTSLEAKPCAICGSYTTGICENKDCSSR